MDLANKILIFAVISAISTTTILNYGTAFVGLKEVFAVTNNTAGSGEDTTVSNTTLAKPSSLEEEHKEIHEKLDKIVSSSGDTASMTKQVQSIMRPHFEKEEQLSIPVPGVLEPYVNGTLTEDTRNQVIRISQQFKKEYPTMLDEHKEIVNQVIKISQQFKKEYPTILDEHKEIVTALGKLLL